LIVIFCDKIDDFVAFCNDKRIMNEIFYEIKETTHHDSFSDDILVTIILHFLAKVSDTLILYETKQNIQNSSEKDTLLEAINSLKNIFSQVDPSIKLVKGKIREIFLSYTS
jgi:hypothetical protein